MMSAGMTLHRFVSERESSHKKTLHQVGTMQILLAYMAVVKRWLSGVGVGVLVSANWAVMKVKTVTDCCEGSDYPLPTIVSQCAEFKRRAYSTQNG